MTLQREQSFRGARRRSIIFSVLESLRVNLATFNLTNMLAEVTAWMKNGIGRFVLQWNNLDPAPPAIAPDTS